MEEMAPLSYNSLKDTTRMVFYLVISFDFLS